MEASIVGIDFIKEAESCVLHSYQDDAGVWTIGWGSTMYHDGTKVGPDQTITQEQADDLLSWEIEGKTDAITNLLAGININQNQFDALTSFTYNCGIGALTSSTLLKTIKINTVDHYIRTCFLMWDKITDPKTGKKIVSEELLNRRSKEANLYFS